MAFRLLTGLHAEGQRELSYFEEEDRSLFYIKIEESLAHQRNGIAYNTAYT